jgi:hypothetical protein
MGLRTTRSDAEPIFGVDVAAIVSSDQAYEDAIVTVQLSAGETDLITCFDITFATFSSTGCLDTNLLPTGLAYGAPPSRYLALSSPFATTSGTSPPEPQATSLSLFAPAMVRGRRRLVDDSATCTESSWTEQAQGEEMREDRRRLEVVTDEQRWSPHRASCSSRISHVVRPWFQGHEHRQPVSQGRVSSQEARSSTVPVHERVNSDPLTMRCSNDADHFLQEVDLGCDGSGWHQSVQHCEGLPELPEQGVERDRNISGPDPHALGKSVWQLRPETHLVVDEIGVRFTSKPAHVRWRRDRARPIDRGVPARQVGCG